MKKIILISLLLAFVTSISYTASSQSSKQVVVNYDDLNSIQKAEIMANELIAEQESQLAVYEKKIEKYGDWVGVGGEVGIAVKEGLEAVVDVADKFGGTDVGMFTMVLVAWKVMGKDVVGIVLGIIFFIVLVTLMLLFFKRVVLNRKTLIKKTPLGFWKGSTKEWVIIESNFDEGDKAITGIVGAVVFLLGIWITYGIMF